MFYSVAGRTVLIKAYDDWSSHSVSHLFAGWFLNRIPEDHTTKPDLTLSIRCGVRPPALPSGLTSFQIAHNGTCHTDHRSYFIKVGDSLINFGPGCTTEVNLWVDQPYELISGNVAQLISHALSPALRRCGVFEIHSAGVIPPRSEKAIIFAGPSGSGKSTITSQLASLGWHYLSDDILLLTDHDNEITVEAFRRFFALTPDTMAAVNLKSMVDAGAGSLKERIAPQDHFETGPVQQAHPGTVMFPHRTNERQTRIIRITPSSAMPRLLRLCPWASYDKPTSGEHLRILARLVNSTSAFDFLAGTDMLHNPGLVADMIRDAATSTQY